MLFLAQTSHQQLAFGGNYLALAQQKQSPVRDNLLMKKHGVLSVVLGEMTGINNKYTLGVHWLILWKKLCLSLYVQLTSEWGLGLVEQERGSLKVNYDGKWAFKGNKVESCSAASHAVIQQELSIKQVTPDCWRARWLWRTWRVSKRLSVCLQL